MSTAPRQLVVVSGKGGTGKTTLLASFAYLAEHEALADCDVDAADLHLVLDPVVRSTHDYFGAKAAVRDESACTKCGECERLCRFDAITRDEVDTLACEGCGLCVLACPARALTLQTIKTGEYFVSDTTYGPMAHAKLSPGGESSGRLVTVVRQQAENLALNARLDTVLIDGPPGIGCTATSALAEVDLALIVTEPTPSGIHDMERVVWLAGHFGLDVAVIVNKHDINADNTLAIERFCEEQDIPLVAGIPYDTDVSKAIAAGKPLVEFSDGPAAAQIRSAWERVSELLQPYGAPN